jgi:hypothetical protein
VKRRQAVGVLGVDVALLLQKDHADGLAALLDCQM